MTLKANNSKTFILALLGLLSMFGPFVTDMYLPCLPEMTNFYECSQSLIQLGITTSLVGLAAGQLLWGPLSDKYGRRKVLIFSMSLFIMTTVLCILSPNIYWFLIWRCAQGAGGAGGIVISRSIATDKFNGKELIKVLALIGAINGVAPVAAPVIGGALSGIIGWQGIFVILLAIGISLGIYSYLFEESLPEERRSKSGVFSTFLKFRFVFKNHKCLFHILHVAFAHGVLFANIASSPFIMQQHYGYSSFAFSIFFAINAVMICLSAGVAVKFKSQDRAVLASCIGMVLFSLLEFIALSNDCNFWAYEILLVGLMFFVGLAFPPSMGLAMEYGREYSGSTSAILGALCFLAGGLASPLVGLGNMMTSTGLVFVSCSILATIFGILAVGLIKRGRAVCS